MSDDPDLTGLRPEQRTAIVALVAGASQAEAARQAGVHKSQITRWLRDSTFDEVLAEAQREQLHDLQGAIRGRVRAAVSVIDQIANGVIEAPASVRLQAAAKILEIAGWSSPRLERTRPPTAEEIKAKAANVYALPKP